MRLNVWGLGMSLVKPIKEILPILRKASFEGLG